MGILGPSSESAFGTRDQLFLVFNHCHKESFPTAQLQQQRKEEVKSFGGISEGKSKGVLMRDADYSKKQLCCFAFHCAEMLQKNMAVKRISVFSLRTIAMTALEIKKSLVALVCGLYRARLWHSRCLNKEGFTLSWCCRALPLQEFVSTSSR